MRRTGSWISCRPGLWHIRTGVCGGNDLVECGNDRLVPEVERYDHLAVGEQQHAADETVRDLLTVFLYFQIHIEAVLDKLGKDVTTYAYDIANFRVEADVVPRTVFYSWVFGFGGKGIATSHHRRQGV